MRMLSLGLLALTLTACDNSPSTEAGPAAAPVANDAGGGAADVSGEVLATVNGVSITVDEFESTQIRPP